MTKPTFVEQKNVGKANETSLQEQVEKEVAAKIKKQLDSGYTYIQQGAKVASFNVTLAQEYTKRKDLNKLQFPYIAQPKLDGIRCYIRWNYDTNEPEMFTRNHKPITSCPHIIRMAKRIMEHRHSAILDGELYNHISQFSEKTSTLQTEEQNFAQPKMEWDETMLNVVWQPKWEGTLPSLPCFL